MARHGTWRLADYSKAALPVEARQQRLCASPQRHTRFVAPDKDSSLLSYPYCAAAVLSTLALRTLAQRALYLRSALLCSHSFCNAPANSLSSTRRFFPPSSPPPPPPAAVLAAESLFIVRLFFTIVASGFRHSFSPSNSLPSPLSFVYPQQPGCCCSLLAWLLDGQSPFAFHARFPVTRLVRHLLASFRIISKCFLLQTQP